MKRFITNLRLLSVCAATTLVAMQLSSCVDDSYNLDNISTEVTVGGEEVILPLGEIKKTTLSDLLSESGDILTSENGVYVLKIDGEGDKFSIDNIDLPILSDMSPKLEEVTFSAPKMPTEFLFSKVSSSFILDYPDFDVAPIFKPLEHSTDINIDLGFDLPEGGNIPAIGNVTLTHSEKISFEADLDIPNEIKRVGKIYLGKNESDYGSLVEVVVAFNGLKSINGGGKINFTATFPSNYTLTDLQGNVIGNKFKVENYEVAAGVENITFKAYLQSIDLSQRTIASGTLSIADEITYNVEYNFNAVAGYCNSMNKPSLTLNMAPQFRDMDIVINEITIDNANHTSNAVYTLNGIPESVQEVQYVAFEKAAITLHIDGMSWLKTDALKAEVQLPEYFIFENDPNGYLNTATNRISAPMRKLEQGVTLNLKAIDCTKCETELKSGQFIIHTSIQSHISDLEDGLTFKLSEVLPPQKTIKIETIIEESHFIIDLAESHVMLKEQYFDFQLDEDSQPHIKHTIDIPDELVAIDRLEVCSPKGDNVKIKLGISHPSGELFPVDKVYLSLSVNLKNMIHPVDGQKHIEKAPNGDYILRLDHIEWKPNENAHLDMVEIEVDALENLPKITGEKGSRKIVIDERFAVTGGLSVDAGSEINLEASGTKLHFDFIIEDASVSKFYGKIDYSIAPDNLPEIELGELAESGLEIENLAVNPIIRFNIDNPIDIPFNANLALKPYDADNNYMPNNLIEIKDVHIAGAGKTQLVLSTRDRRDEFANQAGITFVEVELAKLFNGSIPAKVAVELNVASDTSVTHIIDLTQKRFDFAYDYAVEVPLEFGHAFDISYEMTVDELQPVFDGLRELPIVSIGEVAVMADFTTDIPLDFILDAECLDANGRPTDAQITFGEDNIIHGHHPEDGEPEAHSSLILKLNTGKEANLTQLAEIDAIRFRLNLRNNSQTPSALSPDQTISGLLKLRVRDGITIDLGKLTDDPDAE